MTTQLGPITPRRTRRDQASRPPQRSASIIPLHAKVGDAVAGRQAALPRSLPAASASSASRGAEGLRRPSLRRQPKALPRQQSQALREALAFARALMEQADEQGAIDYYDRWGNKICLKS